jgi:hypothetical protein
MKMIDEMDYSTLLWLQQQSTWKDAVSRCEYRGLRQGIEMEGMVGYISVNVEFDIRDICVFANLMNSRFDDKVHNEIMGIRAKVLGRGGVGEFMI